MALDFQFLLSSFSFDTLPFFRRLILRISANCFLAITVLLCSVALPGCGGVLRTQVGSSSVPSNPSALNPPGNAVSVVTFGGADPNSCEDGIDDMTPIQNTIDFATPNGQIAYFPPGCYTHSGVIEAAGVDLMGEGDLSEIRATNALATYEVSSWSISVQNGVDFVTLSVSGNQYIVGGSPIMVAGIIGYSGTCNPNGAQKAWTVNKTNIGYVLTNGFCPASSGTAGSVANTAPLAAIEMTGSGTQLRDLKITTTWDGPRQSLAESSSVLNEADNFVVDSIHIVGSAAMGYSCMNCTDGQESNSTVESTLADGFSHQGTPTGCPSNVVNSNNVSLNTGDDSFSVNTYIEDACQANHITFLSDQSINSGSRGFEVSGGTNISYLGGSITDASATCVFLYGADPHWLTTGLSNITVSDVTLNGCAINQNGGGILVGSTSAAYPASQITLSGITGSGVVGFGLDLGYGYNIPPEVYMSGVTVSNVSLAGTGTDPYGQSFCLLEQGPQNMSISTISFSNFFLGCDLSNVSMLRMSQGTSGTGPVVQAPSDRWLTVSQLLPIGSGQ